MSMTARGGELAEAQIQEVGNDVLAGLEHADEFIKGGQWSDAVETLARIMENQGEALIQVPVAASWKDHGFSLFVPLREYCQMELASWHGRARKHWPLIAGVSMPGRSLVPGGAGGPQRSAAATHCR